MTIRAELSSDTIAGVVGSTIVINSGSPVLALCRKLIQAGCPSSADLECYRGETLALHVRSIGEAAKLQVDGAGRFIRASGRRLAPPVSLSSIQASS
jgi:hypothetical protein